MTLCARCRRWEIQQSAFFIWKKLSVVPCTYANRIQSMQPVPKISVIAVLAGKLLAIQRHDFMSKYIYI